MRRSSGSSRMFVRTDVMYWRAAARVFGIPRYGILAGAAALVVLTLALMAPQWRLIATVLGSPSFSLSEKVLTIGSLYGTLRSNLSVLTAGSLTGSSALFGVNSALLAYLISRRRPGTGTGVVASIGGLATGSLGVGCAACGSLVLTTVLSFGGAGAALASLPLGGEEFGLIGLALLGWSAILLLKKVQKVDALPGDARHPNSSACAAPPLERSAARRRVSPEPDEGAGQGNRP